LDAICHNRRQVVGQVSPNRHVLRSGFVPGKG
jgi:hypothetical protein